MTSLLGTGVTLEGRFGAGLDLELECVLSLRCRGSSCFMADAATLVVGEEAGPLALAAPEDLAKKPRMLCCLPVDTVPAFFAADTALAGVRAGAVGFSPMTTDWRDGEIVESKYVPVQMLVPMVALQSQQHIQFSARCGRQRVLERGGQATPTLRGTRDTGDAKGKDGSRVQRVWQKKVVLTPSFANAGRQGVGVPRSTVSGPTGKHSNSALET